MGQEKEAVSLQTQLEESEERKKELGGMVEEWTLKMQAWDEERNEEREAYERKLNEVPVLMQFYSNYYHLGDIVIAFVTSSLSYDVIKCLF